MKDISVNRLIYLANASNFEFNIDKRKQFLLFIQENILLRLPWSTFFNRKTTL